MDSGTVLQRKFVGVNYWKYGSVLVNLRKLTFMSGFLLFGCQPVYGQLDRLLKRGLLRTSQPKWSKRVSLQPQTSCGALWWRRPPT
uniref:Uncharacterized protein n=1 Tax=Peronospora matthiolae TaxID=2874970 RepID=A0AAV1TFS6_9STRA